MTNYAEQQARPPDVVGEAVRDIARIIGGEGPEEAMVLVHHAQALGALLDRQEHAQGPRSGGEGRQGLSSSQIRNIFGFVRRIENIWGRAGTNPDHAEQALRNLTMLKPRLAYAVSRDKYLGPLAKVLEPAIDQVLDTRQDMSKARRRFDNFLQFFEAILAYHRAAGVARVEQERRERSNR